MLCSSEHCSKIQQSFPFHIRQEKKLSRILNNISPRFIGFANHCMQPPLWQNKHVGQRENDFERKPPSFLRPTLSLLFLRSESSSLRCQLPKRHTEEKRKGFFLVFVLHLLLWESSGGISGNFSLVFSPEAPLRSKLAKWLIARPGITTSPPSLAPSKEKSGDSNPCFPTFSRFYGRLDIRKKGGGESGVGSLGQMRLGEREKARLASEDPSSLRSRRRRKCAWVLPEFTVSQIGI